MNNSNIPARADLQSVRNNSTDYKSAPARNNGKIIINNSLETFYMTLNELYFFIHKLCTAKYFCNFNSESNKYFYKQFVIF